MSSNPSITREVLTPSKRTIFTSQKNILSNVKKSLSDISNIETQIQSQKKTIHKFPEISPKSSINDSKNIEINTNIQENNPSITPSNIKNTTKFHLTDLDIKNTIQKSITKDIEDRNDFNFPPIDCSQSSKNNESENKILKQSIKSCIKIEDKNMNQFTSLNQYTENVLNTINIENGGDTQRSNEKKDSIKASDINLNFCIDEAPAESIVKGIGNSENFNFGNDINNMDNVNKDYKSIKRTSNKLGIDVEVEIGRTQTFDEGRGIEEINEVEDKSDSNIKSNNIEENSKTISSQKLDNNDGSENNIDNEINTNIPMNNLKNSNNSINTNIKNKKPLSISIVNSICQSNPIYQNIPNEINSINNDNNIKNISDKILITIDSINQETENKENPEMTIINNQNNSVNDNVKISQEINQNQDQNSPNNNSNNNSNFTLISISHTYQPKHIFQSSLCNLSATNNVPNIFRTNPPPQPRIKIYAPNELSPLPANLVDTGPLYRHIKIKRYGLIIPGICNYVNCPGYNKEVLYQIGNVDGYDYVSEVKKNIYVCPLCGRRIKSRKKIGLFNCEYRIERRFGNGKSNKDKNNKSNFCNNDANCPGIIEDQVMINTTKRMEVDFISFDKRVINHGNNDNNSYEFDEKEILIWTYPLDGNNYGNGCIVF